MDSPDGQKVARRAWEAYAKGANRLAAPAVEPVARRAAASVAVDLMGFWLVWHLHGGFEGLRQLGMSRASIYRRIKLFRISYGTHPDEFRLPGVELDVEKYLFTPAPVAQSQI